MTKDNLTGMAVLAIGGIVLGLLIGNGLATPHPVDLPQPTTIVQHPTGETVWHYDN